MSDFNNDDLIDALNKALEEELRREKEVEIKTKREFESFFDEYTNSKLNQNLFNDLYNSSFNFYKQQYNIPYQQPKPAIQVLHHTDDLIITYETKGDIYKCKYIPMDITISIPSALLLSNMNMYMHDTYFGIGYQQKPQSQLTTICSRIVFAIKNFGPTLNAIHERILEDMNKKLDKPFSISYIREHSYVLESPDWEIIPSG